MFPKRGYSISGLKYLTEKMNDSSSITDSSWLWLTHTQCPVTTKIKDIKLIL